MGERARTVAALVKESGPTSDFWRGRKVLVTGHTGFKGCWLSLWLLALGAKVVGVSNNIRTQRSLFQDLGLTQEMRDLRADVRDGAALASIMEAEKPSVVHASCRAVARASVVRSARRDLCGQM